MEDGRKLPGQGVDFRQVRPIVQTASVAREREIIDVIGTAMLLRDDVLNMMCEVAVCLRQAAILASFAGPAPHDSCDSS